MATNRFLLASLREFRSGCSDQKLSTGSLALCHSAKHDSISEQSKESDYCTQKQGNDKLKHLVHRLPKFIKALELVAEDEGWIIKVFIAMEDLAEVPEACRKASPIPSFGLSSNVKSFVVNVVHSHLRRLSC